MYDKIINYGDSFTTADNCACEEHDLWFRRVFKDHDNDVFLNRAKSGNSLEAIALEVMHDAITHSQKLLQIISIPVLPRIMMYNDEWFEKEQLTYEKILESGTRRTNLSDCQEYFGTFYVDDIKDKHMINMYHPTLVRAKMLYHVISLNSFARSQGNEIIFVHMHERPKVFDERHPLINPFVKITDTMDNYVTELYSCSNVCAGAGIKPWDHEQHHGDGHYSKAGQEYFAGIIKDKLKKFVSGQSDAN